MNWRKYLINLKSFTNAVKILIAMGVLFWLVYSGRLDYSVLFSVSFSSFHVLGLVVLLVSMLLQSVRWWWLLKVQNIDLSLGKVIQLSWISQFFSSVLPGTVGGELVRAYYIARSASTIAMVSVSTVLLDRAIGLYALLWLGVLPLLIVLGLPGELPLVGLQMVILISLLVVSASIMFTLVWLHPTRRLILSLMPKRLCTSLEVILGAYRTYGWTLMACFGLSLLANSLLMVAFLLLARSCTLLLIGSRFVSLVLW